MIERARSPGVPLLLTALALGWGCLSLTLLTVAGVQGSSILLRLLAHVVLAFAVGAGSLGLVLLLCRPQSPGSHRWPHYGRRASGAALVAGAWLMQIGSGANPPSLVALAAMIAMSLALDHRPLAESGSRPR